MPVHNSLNRNIFSVLTLIIFICDTFVTIDTITFNNIFQISVCSVLYNNWRIKFAFLISDDQEAEVETVTEDDSINRSSNTK